MERARGREGGREGIYTGHIEMQAHTHTRSVFQSCVEEWSSNLEGGRQAGRSSLQFETSASPAWAARANAGPWREPRPQHTKAQKCLSSLINIAQRFLFIAWVFAHVCWCSCRYTVNKG